MLKFLLMLLSSTQKVAYYAEYYAHENLVPLFVPNCSLITITISQKFL